MMVILEGESLRGVLALARAQGAKPKGFAILRGGLWQVQVDLPRLKK